MPYADPAAAAANKRAHYEANRDAYKARAAAYTTRQRERLREIVAETKRGTPCADCGETHPECVMDFDHVGGDKDRAIADLVSAGVSVARLLAEIEKCEIVCANCHRVRTHERMRDGGPGNRTRISAL